VNELVVVAERPVLNLGIEAPSAQPSSCPALYSSVLSAALSSILLEGLIDPRITYERSFLCGLLVGDEKVLVMVDVDDASLDLEHDLLSHHPVGNQVPGGVVRDLCACTGTPLSISKTVCAREVADEERTKAVGENRRWDNRKGAGGEKIGCRAAPSGLRIAIRFLPGASRRSIKRLKRTSFAPSKLVAPAAAYPQPRWAGESACAFRYDSSSVPLAQRTFSFSATDQVHRV